MAKALNRGGNACHPLLLGPLCTSLVAGGVDRASHRLEDNASRVLLQQRANTRALEQCVHAGQVASRIRHFFTEGGGAAGVAAGFAGGGAGGAGAVKGRSLLPARPSRLRIPTARARETVFGGSGR